MTNVSVAWRSSLLPPLGVAALAASSTPSWIGARVLRFALEQRSSRLVEPTSRNSPRERRACGLHTHTDSMRWRVQGFALLVVSLAPARTLAQQAQRVWTEIETSVAHATVAQVACGLDAKALVDGRSWVIALDAVEDSAQLCTSSHEAPDALHGHVKMTQGIGRRPSEVIIELDPPPNASPRATDDLRRVLQNMSADLGRRAWAAAPTVAIAEPIPLVQPVAPPPAPVPTHPVSVANIPLIAAGFGVAGATYLVSALVGVAILGASGDPGTGRVWPFVPLAGLTIFSATYIEAPNCDCDAGRALSLVGSVIIDAAQIAGVVIGILGVTNPKTRMVAFGPHGVEVRF